MMSVRTPYEGLQKTAAVPLLGGAVLFVLLAVLPTLFVAWMLRVRRRNRLSSWEAKMAKENSDVVAK